MRPLCFSQRIYFYFPCKIKIHINFKIYFALYFLDPYTLLQTESWIIRRKKSAVASTESVDIVIIRANLSDLKAILLKMIL